MPNTIELPAPILGVSKVARLSEQPPLTSREAINVRSMDPTTGRVRMSPRPGLSPYMPGYLSGQGNKIQALASVAYQARHVDYAADAIPDELWAASFASGATASICSPGLYDDFYTVENNVTLRRYNRYGVLLGSIDIPNVLTAVSVQHIVNTIHVAPDGSVYVGVTGFTGAAPGTIAGTLIWKFVLDFDGLTHRLAWYIQPGTGGFVTRMWVKDDVLYTLETQFLAGVAAADIVKYENINTGNGPDTGDRDVLITIDAALLNTLDATTWNNIAYDFYGHDMVLKTNGALEFIVCGGTVQDAGVGRWALLKIKSDFTTSTSYVVTNSEIDASAVGPPIRGGGIGLACAVDATGSVYSIGRRNPSGTPDNVWMRKLVDTSTAWSTATGWTRLTTTDLGGAANNPQYGYPRTQLDKFGNFFAPTARNTAGVKAALVVRPDGSLFTSIQIEVYVIGVATATNNETRAICLPVTAPDFLPDDDPITDTAFIVGSPVATLLSGTSNAMLLGYDILSETPTSISSRNVAMLGVSAGNIMRFTTSGPTVPTNNTSRFPVLGNNARFVQSANMFGEVFFTDGSNYAVYKPSPNDTANPDGVIANWNATSLGVIPPRARLITAWRGRMVLAHTADSPYAWHMSAFGDPYNWDLFPPEPLATQAVSGVASPVGDTPDIINALVSYSDDLLFFGCDHHIFRLSGDPMAGGELHLVSDQIGMSFGTPWCKDFEGRVFFFGSRGGIYAMAPSGEIVWLTQNTIESDLTEIDLSVNRVELAWNSRDNGLHVFVMPYSFGGTHLKHYFWSQDTKGWFQDEFGTQASTIVQPTAALCLDGDLPGDRVMLLGTEDGRVVQWDQEAKSDAGSVLDARLLYGPILGSQGDFEAKFSRPSVVLGKELGGANIKFFASDTPETPEMPTQQFRVAAGVNERLPMRARGSYVWAQIRSAGRVAAGVPARQEKWAVESIHVDVAQGGRKRARSR